MHGEEEPNQNKEGSVTLELFAHDGGALTAGPCSACEGEGLIYVCATGGGGA